jgi:prevent-host-death family protein
LPTKKQVRTLSDAVVFGASVFQYTLLYISMYTENAMREATFTELRNHARQYFDQVEAGETVRVVRNGKPIADIVPIQPDLPSWKQRKTQPLVLGGLSISQLVLNERDG